MCGVQITFGRPISGEFFGGSSTKTSSAAPPRRPLFNASASAASSINSPRAAFTMRAVFFILAMATALMTFWVAGLNALCNEIKSLSASIRPIGPRSQFRRFIQKVRGHQGGAANNQRIGIRQLRADVLLGGQHGVESCFLQKLHAALADFVRHYDFHESS